MYSITLTSEVFANGLQLKLIFSVDDTGDDEDYSFSEKGIRIKNSGKLSWKYDLEDLLIVPGSYRCELYDYYGYLDSLVFGNDLVDKRYIIELYVSSALKFSGKVIEEGGNDYDSGNKTLLISAACDLDVINNTKLYDGTTETNPLSYTNDTWYYLTEVIHDIYKLANSEISFEFNQNWTYRLKREATGGAPDLRVYDGIAEELKIKSTDLFFNSSSELTSLFDILRTLAIDFGCLTGMISGDKAFYSMIFNYDSSNLQTVGRIYSHKKRTEYSKIDYVKVHMSDYFDDFTAGTITADTTKTLERDTFIFISETFYTAYNNVKAYLNRPEEFLFYEISDAPANAGDIYSNNLSQYEVIYGLGIGRHFRRISGTNLPHASGTLTKVSGDGPATMTYTGNLRLNGVDFLVTRAQDSNIDETGYDEYGELLANYWYHHRGNINKCRADQFLVAGIDYDFLKNFNYDGGKYQIMEMEIDLANEITEIKGLYLGAVS